MAAKRSRSLPDIPTVVETGLPNFEAGSWFGFFAPKGTPDVVVATLNKAVNEILNSPEGKAKLLGMGITPTPGSPEKFGEQIKSDLLRFSPIVKGMQIKSE